MDKKAILVHEREFLKELKDLAREKPDEIVRLIIHLARPPKNLPSVLEKRGVRVKHEYRLINAVAIETSAKMALELEKEAWVVKIEEDKEVKAL